MIIVWRWVNIIFPGSWQDLRRPDFWVSWLVLLFLSE